MPQAKTEVALQFLECRAAEVALQHSLFCSAEVVFTKSCAAASEKLQCSIEKAALQQSGAFLPLSCGFQAPTFRHPRLGPAEKRITAGVHNRFWGAAQWYVFQVCFRAPFLPPFLPHSSPSFPFRPVPSPTTFPLFTSPFIPLRKTPM